MREIINTICAGVAAALFIIAVGFWLIAFAGA